MAVIIKEIPEGSFISVLKVYREYTGLGLKEAKDALQFLPVTIYTLDEEKAIQNLVSAGAKVCSDKDDLNTAESESNQLDNNASLISPDFVGSLGRNELLAVLEDIKKLTKRIDKCYSTIISSNNDIERVKKKADEIRNEVSTWVYTSSFILTIGLSIFLLIYLSWFGILFGIISGVMICKKLLKPMDKLKNQSKRDQAANAYLMENTAPLREKIEIAQNEITKIRCSNEGVWAIEIIGEDLFSLESVNQLIEIVKSRRADTLKEALNKYDNTVHTNRMEEMQAAIQNASELAAVESVKQTELAAQTARSAHQAATAAKITAYNTRQIDKNTRNFRRKNK